MNTNWLELIGKRLLLTDILTRIQRSEWTLLEISPSGKTGKFINELSDCQFWTDLDELVVLDVLPPLTAGQKELSAHYRAWIRKVIEDGPPPQKL